MTVTETTSDFFVALNSFISSFVSGERCSILLCFY